MSESKGALPHFVYVLRCIDDSLYIGVTDDVGSRLLKHGDGSASRYTALRRPVQLVYVEEHSTRNAAFKRESQIKRWTRAKKEALLAGDAALLKRI